MTNKLTFDVNLNSDQVKDYYRGKTDRVRLTAKDGTSVSIPYNILLDFLSREGIYGTFNIYYHDDGKFNRIERVK